MITLIAAVAKNNVIGKEGALPWYLPEDLKRFKALTTGKVVLMGRKTFESILKRLGKPLPNRTNVVITRDMQYNVGPGLVPGRNGGVQDPALQSEWSRNGGVQDPALQSEWSNVEIYHSIDDALAAHQNQDIMVIGGGQIYAQTIDRADRLEITEVHQEIAGDVFFPKIDPQVWQEVARENRDGYSFVTYSRT